MSDEKNPAEVVADVISSDVKKVIDHLENNRTTETEAKKIEKAAHKSITDHSLAKKLG